MRTSLFTRAMVGVAVFTAFPAAAFAQSWTPGSEIVGQSVQVETNGAVNTVFFDPGGSARVVSAGGNTVQGTWSAANGSLCLNVGGAQECWPYSSPFQAGQQVSLTSSCNATSRWLASSTNQPPAQQSGGERG
jgi:hypothetical protein